MNSVTEMSVLGSIRYFPAVPLVCYNSFMKQFLLIGLDGMDPGLVEPWMSQGHLPNLARLRDKGTYLPLSSTVPPATFPAWTSCVTWVNPGRHGIFDFTEMVSGKYALHFANSTYRKAPAIWNILSEVDKRVGIVGVPGTYPPENVNGLMVSGFDSPLCTEIDTSFVYPQELYNDVRGWTFADFQETNIGPGWHDMALPRLMEGIDRKESTVTRLLEREPWDFFMVVFGESDTVAHHFWLFHDQNSPRHRHGHQNAILNVYKRLDQAVGKLISVVGEDTTIGIVSDHGFGGAGTGIVHLNNWLESKGYLKFLPDHSSILKKLALTVTPEKWRGKLFRMFRDLAAKAESQSRFSGIDWSQTTAWSEELNYFPSIRVNLAGREPNGQVSESDYDSFCRNLCEELEEWDVIEKAWHRDDLFSGDYVSLAPDIVLKLNLENGYSHSCLRSRGGPVFKRITSDEYLGGKERGMNGNHRPTGVLFLSKPSIATSANIVDVAPTILADLDVPVPPMDGQSLLKPTIDGDAPLNNREKQVYSEEQERKVEDRLRNLGYFE